jgi:hypothetical protein
MTMPVDALDDLENAFAEWRRAKNHAREPIPEELLVRARRATREHGVAPVVRVTEVKRASLFRAAPSHLKAAAAVTTKPQSGPRAVPTYSRLELSVPVPPSSRPIAEVEMRSGVTLRVFEPTPEMMGLLTAACGIGGLQ